MRLAIVLVLLILPIPVSAQVVLQGGSFQTSSSANTTASGGATCSDPQGGVNVPMAASSCADADGNTAAGSAQAIVFVDTQGADFSLTTSGGGAVTVGAPGPLTAQANGGGSANAVRNWFMTNDTLYSMAVATGADFAGHAAAASVFVGFSGGSAASGLLSSGSYALNANVSATAGGIETGLLTGAASASADVRLTFAEAASPTLVRGTVLAEGVGLPGLLVEAFDGATLIDSALTGDDGSYLLPGVTTSVTLRVSDPEGAFATIESGLLAPPATFDTDLSQASAVPALAPAPLGLAAFGMAGAGWLARRRRSARRDEAAGTP